MQYKESGLKLPKGLFFKLVFIAFALSVKTSAQTTYLPQAAEESILIERMEIKAQKDSVLNFSKNKPFSREVIVGRLSGGAFDSLIHASKVDDYNYRRLLINNLEWASTDRSSFRSKKPWGKNFYQTRGTFCEVHVKDFDLAVNPVLQFQFSKENNNDQTLFLNSRGLSIRGRIANKIGFSTYLTDNQERDPLYVQQWENKFKSVPGAGYYKNFKTTGYDYFDARGYFTFGVAKYIDVTFGYDKNFIGNGYRSLFLSDFSNNILFLKLNTRVWKLNYQNLFMELNATEPRAGDRLLKKKYAVMHHLDVNVTKSINIGLFEGIVFGRPNHFEFGYLNPVIFYRSVEQQNGSFDNAVVGLDVKANVKRALLFYSQLLIDEFILSAVRDDKTSWVNKWGLQVGAKYIDAFGIKNLDLQVEANRVRPFTYSHNDSVANYTHYNQPLAHPLGANFQEFIAIARYQPAAKWLLVGKLFGWKQGLDDPLTTENFGSNIFLPNSPPYRTRENGYKIGEGAYTAKAVLANFLVSYELRQNLFIDLSALLRNYKVDGLPAHSKNTSVISFGLRFNMHRREFEF
ncbi:MAG: hypothetical protein C4308_01240 [Chitinophagaceae bacterium]